MRQGYDKEAWALVASYESGYPCHCCARPPAPFSDGAPDNMTISDPTPSCPWNVSHQEASSIPNMVASGAQYQDFPMFQYDAYTQACMSGEGDCSITKTSLPLLAASEPIPACSSSVVHHEACSIRSMAEGSMQCEDLSWLYSASSGEQSCGKSCDNGTENVVPAIHNEDDVVLGVSFTVETVSREDIDLFTTTWGAP